MSETLIAARGSLELYHDPGDERRPETFTIKNRDDRSLQASLEVARDWYSLADRNGRPVRLNGSQAQTVRLWNEEHLT